MRVLLQRVSQASVSVDGEVVGAIGSGLALLVGISADDTERELELLAGKVTNLRIFQDADGKMNRSALDLLDEDEEISLLVISQFTLYGDVRKGRRPSFIAAAPPEMAAPMFEQFAIMLAHMGFVVATGVFGAHMVVTLSNDGPVTIWIDSDELRKPR